MSEDEVLRSRAAYWGLVHRVDALIGQVMTALEANDLDRNTLIVYTSDHGDMQGEHGLWWKHVFYQESVGVPLIVHWPEVVQPGQRCDHVVSALDVAATMLDALDAPALPGSPGRSFLGLISDRRAAPAWDDVAFAEYCADEYSPDPVTLQRMIRRDQWKLVYYHGYEPQLFNLAEDPGERVDRARDPACRAVRRELTTAVLDGWQPEVIRSRLASLRADAHILREWARRTLPEDRYRWPLHPEMNYLDKQ